MNADEMERLTKAVILWTGWGKDLTPQRSDNLVIKHFEPNVALEILSEIKSLEADFYLSDARFTAKNIGEMEKLTSDHFRKKHPEIAEEIVKAFAWCYTFDFK